MQTGWMKWREGKGVLCDKRVPLKVKGKLYATVVRPALTYASVLGVKERAGEEIASGGDGYAKDDDGDN